ncbi:Solute carrier family 22 member 6-B [Holothuria leucospilota]|uniref:Solute carrier family 22 member 6-B n=1 Tax=Holothuria leucospilota TaxID=206669 RepID=A0A9Q1BC70_HOLLE|nr:Solute carrier family 22 member 6-B [Holothuria leucospilota]
MDFHESLKLAGNFGRYQKALTLLLGAPILLACLQIYVQVFAAGKSDHWCQSWENEDCKDLNLTEFQCEHLKRKLSIPYTLDDDNETVYGHCEKYNVTGIPLETAALIDKKDTSLEEIPCDSGWAHDKSTFPSTIIIDFELVCGQSYLPNVAQSAYFAGYFVGSIVCGLSADIIGRRWTIISSITMTFAAGMANAFSPNMWMYIVLRFFTGVGVRATNTCIIILTSELVSPTKRTTLLNSTFVLWGVGYFVLAGLAKLITNWRFLQLAISLPCLPVLITVILFVVESPLWLSAKERLDEAEKVLQKVAKFNGKTPTGKISQPAKQSPQMMETLKTKELLKDLLRSPHVILITLNMCFNWFVQSVVYYGLSLSTSSLGIDPYISFIVSGAIEIPAYMVCMFLPELIGRKGSTGVTMVLGGISCCLTLLLPLGVWRALLAMAGKFCISISFSVVCTWSAELYPTTVRTSAMGLFSMSSRVGAILVPFMLIMEDVWPSLPLLIMGCLSITAGLLCIFFPETKGRPMPSTFEDIKKLYRNVSDRQRNQH